MSQKTLPHHVNAVATKRNKTLNSHSTVTQEEIFFFAAMEQVVLEIVTERKLLSDTWMRCFKPNPPQRQEVMPKWNKEKEKEERNN